MEIRKKPLLALVQGLFGRSRLVEPRGQNFARSREAKVLEVSLDAASDRREVVRGSGLDGGGDAVEEVRGLRGGADGGWCVERLF